MVEAAGDARASPTFTTTLTVPPEAIDELGHASNVGYVRWVQDAAKAHSEAAGWDHARYAALGAVFVVRRYELDYLGPAYAGDALVIETFVVSWSAASSVRKTRIIRAGKTIFTASTLWAFVSMTTGRPTRIPESIREAFANTP